jgi:CBS domain containing-hemolysin-like protein
MSNPNITRVLMSVADRQGYAPDQIEGTITLRDLLEAVTDAIDEFGEDAQVVVANGDRYGAAYGSIPAWSDVFTAVEDDEDDDPYA